MEHLYALFYTYFPRFMRETYECREDHEDGSPADYSAPPGPHDVRLEIRFFNFFGKAICRTETTQPLR